MKVFSIKTDSILLSSIKMIAYLKERDQKNYIFLNLENLMKKEGVKELIKSFQDDHKGHLSDLLILCYDSSLDDNHEQEIFEASFKMIQGNQKRIILITSAEDDGLTKKFEKEYVEQSRYKKIEDKATADHLKDASRILEQEIMFLGQPTALNKLITSNKDLIRSIDSEILYKIIRNQSREIQIGSKPLGISDLEGAYAELYELMRKL